MQTLTREQIAGLPTGDVYLTAIQWQQHDMALVLMLILPDNRRAQLTATWARGLRVNLEFDAETGGSPFTWHTRYSELPDGQWHVVMDFANTGAVEFDCSALLFEYLTDPA